MKKLSSVFYMWVGLASGLIAVLMMFVPVACYSGTTLSASQMFWGNGYNGGAWPAFVGYMLILVGAIMMGVIALPFMEPSIRAEKIVLISAGALILIGTILVGLITVEYAANNGIYQYLDYLAAGFYLSLFFSLVSLACDVVALVLDW